MARSFVEIVTAAMELLDLGELFPGLVQGSRRFLEEARSYTCPISLGKIEEPVLLPGGEVFDLESINTWLASNNLSPMTGLPLEHKKVLRLSSLLAILEKSSDEIYEKRRWSCETDDPRELALWISERKKDHEKASHKLAMAEERLRKLQRMATACRLVVTSMRRFVSSQKVMRQNTGKEKYRRKCFNMFLYAVRAQNPRLQPALHHAIDTGNLTEVIQAAKGNINDLNVHGVSPLGLACLRGHTAIVKYLINCNAHKYGGGYVKVLTLAVLGGHSDITKLLLPLRKNQINRKQESMSQDLLVKFLRVLEAPSGSWIPEMSQDMECRHRDDVLHPLLDRMLGGVDPYSSLSGSPLYIATAFGHENMVEFLLEQGADTAKSDNQSEGHQSLVQLAVQTGHLRIMRCLLENKADSNNHSLCRTALTKKRNAFITALAPRNYYTTPLCTAVENLSISAPEEYSIFDLLLDAKADPNFGFELKSNECMGSLGTALYFEGSSNYYDWAPDRHWNLVVIRRLLEASANLDKVDKAAPYKYTALTWIIHRGYEGAKVPSLLRLLLQAHADPNDVCRHTLHAGNLPLGINLSPLWLACKFEMPECAEILVESRADPHYKCGVHKTTPLQETLRWSDFLLQEQLREIILMHSPPHPNPFPAKGRKNKKSKRKKRH